MSTVIAAAAALFIAVPRRIEPQPLRIPSRPPEYRSAAAPRPGGWRIIGPGGGGALFAPAISPHDSELLFAASDMSGAYVSHDGGNTWRMFHLAGTPVSAFVFDPADSQRVWAAAGPQLFLSGDSGGSWERVHPPRNVTPTWEGDEGSVAFPAFGAASGTIDALAVSPSRTGVLHAAFGAQICISGNSGRSWTPVYKLPAGRARAILNTGDAVVVVGEHGAAFHRDDQWTEFPRLPHPEPIAAAAAVRDGGDTVLLARTRSALLASRDSGASWRRIVLPGVAAAGFRALATSGSTIYVSFSDLRFHAKARTAYMGVARSDDAGRTWSFVWKENSQAAANVHDAWITRRFGPHWGESPHALAVSATDPHIVLATDFGRAMRSTDGGANWHAVYSKPFEDGTYSSTGLDVTTCYGVHLDPFNPYRIFVSTTDIGLFRSESGGDSWTSATETVPREWTNTTYWMVFDPSVQGRAWAAMSNTHDLPRMRVLRKTSVETSRGGVVISADGGVTWRRSNRGLPEMAVTHLLLDPLSSPSRRVLYAAGFGHGVYKSLDGGASWNESNTGLPARALAWRLALGADATLYLVVVRGLDTPAGLYRSSDAAQTWESVPLPDGAASPTGIAVTSEHLYLAAWPKANGLGGGVWISADAGRTWRQTFSAATRVYDVSVDTGTPQAVYASGFHTGAIQSLDGGNTWTQLPGFDFARAHRIIPDPRDPRFVFVTTFGGGLWYGPRW